MVSLKTMVWVVVFMALLPLVILAFVTADHIRRASIERFETETLELVQVATHEQEHLFDLARIHVEWLAKIPAVRAAQSNPERCSAALLSSADDAGEGYAFMLVDAVGDTICGSIESTVNFSDRSWFRRTLERAGFATGDYLMSRISDEVVVVLAVPVEFEGGGVGVLGHGVNLEWFSKVFADSELPESVSLSVVDGGGTVLASFPDNRVGEAFADQELFDIAVANSSGMLDRGRSGGMSVFQSLAEGIDDVFVIATVSTLPAYRAANGFLAVNLTVLLLLALVLATLLKLMADRLLVRPLGTLLQGYASIEQGKLDVRLQTSAPLREIATAARSFNRMTETLAERTAQLHERETYSRLLYTITSQLGDDIEQRLQSALKLSTEILGLDRGIISSIEGDSYTVEHAFPPDGTVGRGMQLELGSTYCSLISSERPVLALHHIGDSELSGHPCYRALGIESYIGVHLHVGGEPYGTLSFSSAAERHAPFSSVEREFVELLARWAGSAIERKQLDDGLAAKEARYRGVVGSLAEGVVILDRDGAVIEVNASALDTLDVTHDQLLGRDTPFPGWTLLQEDGNPLRDPEWPSVVSRRTGHPVSGEVVGLKRPGEATLWLLVNSRPLDMAEVGNPSMMVTSFLDISNRIRSEQAVVAEKLRFKAIFDSAFQFIGLIQPDGILLEANETALDFAGIAADEVLGRPLWECPWWSISHETQAELKQAVARAAAGEFVRYNVDILGEGGRVTTIDFSLKPVRDDMDRVVLLVPEGRVIDEMIEAKLQLEHYAAELERSNRELQQFAYVASHDLKEPLRAISGYVGLIDRRYADRLDDDGREFIAYAVDASTRMAGLIDALLEFSRVGASAMKREQVPLDRVFASVRKALSYLLDDCGAHLTVDPLPTVLAAEVQMEQLFQNLITNGIKFRGEAVPRIRVTAELLADVWRISVRDNGIGIDREYQERIFTIFQRLHTHDLYEGTGIGLAVCKRIAERHGATIGVESVSGEGSSFYIDFPVGMVMHGSQIDRDLVG